MSIKPVSFVVVFLAASSLLLGQGTMPSVAELQRQLADADKELQTARKAFDSSLASNAEYQAATKGLDEAKAAASEARQNKDADGFVKALAERRKAEKNIAAITEKLRAADAGIKIASAHVFELNNQLKATGGLERQKESDAQKSAAEAWKNERASHHYVSIGVTVNPLAELKDALNRSNDSGKKALKDLPKSGTGLFVRSIEPDGPFAKAGGEATDIITKIGTTAMGNAEAYKDWIRTAKPDETYRVTIMRLNANGQWLEQAIDLRTVEPRILGTFNSIEVTILDYGVAKVPLTYLNNPTESKEELLFVKLRLRNMSGVQKTTYSTWQGADFAIGRDFATATDNFGNVLKRVDFGFATEIAGGVKRSESIYPGKSLDDILVFEHPVDRTTSVKIELPKKNIEAEGDAIVVELPVK